MAAVAAAAGKPLKDIRPSMANQNDSEPENPYKRAYGGRPSMANEKDATQSGCVFYHDWDSEYKTDAGLRRAFELYPEGMRPGPFSPLPISQCARLVYTFKGT